jgi:molybdopterin/thiamine biosynthesis adenylyltransferase
MLPEVGEAGQVRLLKSKVLLVGAGGLGSPIALYLAAAGVGTLGVVDNDSVSLSNLQRQVIHTQVGKLKVPSVTEAIQRLTPDVSTIEYLGRMTAANADQYFNVNYDLVIDACDNLATRYIINENCVKRKIPWIHGAVSRYEGQVTTFTFGTACYRCLYPDLDILFGGGRPPRSGGVLGVVPGMIGMIQATEALKLLLKIGDSLSGRMIIFDALSMRFQEMKLRPRSTSCPACNGI